MNKLLILTNSKKDTQAYICPKCFKHSLFNKQHKKMIEGTEQQTGNITPTHAWPNVERGGALTHKSTHHAPKLSGGAYTQTETLAPKCRGGRAQIKGLMAKWRGDNAPKRGGYIRHSETQTPDRVPLNSDYRNDIKRSSHNTGQ